MRSKACNQHARSYTVNVKIVGLTGALVAFMASPAGVHGYAQIGAGIFL
jgi:hypothetical protein